MSRIFLGLMLMSVSISACGQQLGEPLADSFPSAIVELREVVLRDKPEHMLEISPKGTVPVLLLQDGNVVEESIDIMVWALGRQDPEEWLGEDDDGLIITLNIYEGPKYFYRNINWNGNYIYSNEELNNKLGILKGDSFNQTKFLVSISERVNPLYMDDGYFHFQAIPEIIPVFKDSLDINFLISEGDLVKVRKIIISGNSKTYENVVRRELMIFPGDTFSRKKLLESYRDIFMLNFFRDVIPNVIPVDNDEIDITFDVEEKESGQANFSMGYSGVGGFQGGGGFQFPNFFQENE